MKTIALRHIASIQNSNVDKHTVDGEQPVRLCNYVDVYKNDEITPQIEFMKASASASEIEKFRLRIDDVIITKDSEDRFDIGVPAYVSYQADDLLCGYHLAILKPKYGIVMGKFLFWALQSKQVRDEFSLAANGVTRFGLTLDGIKSVPIPLPVLSVQTQIADFLDRETSRIDRLIEKKRRFAELVREAQGALIAAAVSGKILEPSDTHDGDWLGQIPEHWKFQRAKVHFRERIGRSDTGEEDLLTVSHITGVTSRSEKDVNMFMAESNEGYKLVQPDDIVINTMWAWMGAMGVSPLAGLISPSYGVYEPVSDAFIPEYVDLLIRSSAFVVEATRRSKGIHSSRLRLYPDAFLDIRLPVPPVPDQQKIVSFVQRRLEKDKQLLELNEKTINLLLEKRAALITAAVTGQLDVTAVNAVQVSANDNVSLLVAAEIIRSHERSQKFGRVKFQKIVYIAEAHCGVQEFGGQYTREAAGPLDRTLLSRLESELSEAGLYRADQDGDGGAVTYTALDDAHDTRSTLTHALGDRAEGVTAMLQKLRDMDTHAVEAIATLYAVWNDHLIEGDTPDDPAIITGVLDDWHPEKKDKFRADELQTWLGWMRRNDFIPKGQGPMTTTGRLFV